MTVVVRDRPDQAEARLPESSHSYPAASGRSRPHAVRYRQELLRQDVRTDLMRGNQLTVPDAFRAPVPTLQAPDDVPGPRPSVLRLESGRSRAPEYERVLVGPLVVDLRASRADAVTGIERHSQQHGIA
jgi:hypothetical protein